MESSNNKSGDLVKAMSDFFSDLFSIDTTEDAKKRSLVTIVINLFNITHQNKD